LSFAAGLSGLDLSRRFQAAGGVWLLPRSFSVLVRAVRHFGACGCGAKIVIVRETGRPSADLAVDFIKGEWLPLAAAALP